MTKGERNRKRERERELGKAKNREGIKVERQLVFQVETFLWTGISRQVKGNPDRLTLEM